MNDGIRWLIASCLLGWLIGVVVHSGVIEQIIFEQIDKHGDFLQNIVLTVAGLLVIGILIIGA